MMHILQCYRLNCYECEIYDDFDLDFHYNNRLTQISRAIGTVYGN